MEKVEAELRMIREERECVRMIMMEEEAQSRKMEKIDRLKKAWLLKMNARKYQRMVIMMEEKTVEDMAMDTMDIMEDMGTDIGSGFVARSGWESSQGGDG